MKRHERSNLVFVDVDAEWGKPTPYSGWMTDIGCITFPDMVEFAWVFPLRERATAEEYESSIEECARTLIGWLRYYIQGQPVMVTDNPAYDFQWIAWMFDLIGVPNPFGHSARRIGDYYAGLTGNFRNTQRWKRLRITQHDHIAVHDAKGNAEAFKRIQDGER